MGPVPGTGIGKLVTSSSTSLLKATPGVLRCQLPVADNWGLLSDPDAQLLVGRCGLAIRQGVVSFRGFVAYAGGVAADSPGLARQRLPGEDVGKSIRTPAGVRSGWNAEEPGIIDSAANRGRARRLQPLPG